jgi:hypothetical protein
LRLAREIGDRVAEAELVYRLGLAHHLRGEHGKATALIEESLQHGLERRERDRFKLAFVPEVYYRTWLVSILAECGDFQAGMIHARNAVASASETQHPLSEVLGWLAVGHLALRKSDLDDAIDALERGVTLSDRYSLPLWRARLVSHARRGARLSRPHRRGSATYGGSAGERRGHGPDGRPASSACAPR